MHLADSEWQAKSKSLEFYNKVGGVEQGKLASDPIHASYYDRPRYAELVGMAIALAGQPTNLALDLGCGDGRATRMLLQQGVPHVIAMDFHLPSLRRLVSSLDSVDRNRVVPICAPITTGPIAGVSCDVATCVEVLTTLPDPGVGLNALQKWLVPGKSAALVAEPAVEGSLLYALIEGDLRVLENILEGHRRHDVIGQHSLEVHLRTRESLADFMRSGGFEVVEQRQIPASAALALFALKKSGAQIGVAELGLLRLADALQEVAPRMHAAIARVLPCA